MTGLQGTGNDKQTSLQEPEAVRQSQSSEGWFGLRKVSERVAEGMANVARGLRDWVKPAGQPIMARRVLSLVCVGLLGAVGFGLACEAVGLASACFIAGFALVVVGYLLYEHYNPTMPYYPHD